MPLGWCCTLLGKLILLFLLVGCTSQYKIKSLVYTDYGSGAYKKSDFEKYLSLLNEYKFNTASLLYTCHAKNINSSDFNCNDYNSPRLDILKERIYILKSKGLKVSLRFYIDLLDKNWRAKLKPKDFDLFFKKFEIELVAFSKFAQRNKVDTLLMGSELEKLTKPEYYKYWIKIIAQIRKVFKGQLSYAANGNLSVYKNKEYSWIKFWDRLDFISITYYPPSLKVLETSSDFLKHHKNSLKDLENFGKKLNQKVVLAEVGFPLAKNGYKKPYEWVWPDGKIDKNEQYKSIKGFIESFNTTELDGYYIWRYYPEELKEYPGGYFIFNDKTKLIFQQ